ncbi:protein phosphatase 2C [Dictyocaulus viviparus]|uniref:Protein phosphatase 2C n=1 Tax=Dictyocaulus viviparus TaxID=29172 RepID=A0A0D8Y4J0_DICVI|nr:protein phosphatase 2C [Dictyocaulus viviparus]
MSSYLGSSLRSEAIKDQPLTVISICPRSALRTWRLTPTGLVEIIGENRAVMGAFLDKPKTAKTNCSGEGNGLRYAMASMQGWRVDMEDAHVVEVSMADREPYKDWSFFAVFDGHAGNVAADDAAENIMKTLMDTPQFEKVTEELRSNGGVLCEKSINLLEDGIKSGFLSLDENIRTRLDSDRSGSTAICAMITPTHIIIANLGDSRAVVSRKNEGSFGTEDHKPYNDKERERIIGAGGSVMIQRINGSLAVSRALGDFEYKNVPGLEPNKQLVSPEPDVYVLERQKEKDEFLVVACDGIYDVMENEELCRFVESRLHVCDDLNQVCNDVLDACLSKGSRDNMTMIVVCFEAAPSIDKEKVASEQTWKAEMLKAINDVVIEETSKPGWTENDEMSIEFVLRELAQRNSSPSGGPVHMLYSLTDQKICVHCQDAVRSGLLRKFRGHDRMKQICRVNKELDESCNR